MEGEWPFSPQFKDFIYEVFLRIRNILPPSLQSLLLPTRPPSQWVHKRSPVPFGVEHKRLSGVLLSISESGRWDRGAPLRFASQCLACDGNVRFRGTQPAVPPSSRGPHSAVRPAGAAALGGFPGRLPRPSGCSASSVQGGAVRPAPSRTGFVIASPPFPPSASPTSAGPPSAPPPRRGASPGTPHWRARSGSPPPAAAGRLDVGAAQVRSWGWAPARAPRLPCRAAPHRILGVGEEGVQGCGQAGSVGKGCAPSVTVPIHDRAARRPRPLKSGRERRDWGAGGGGRGTRAPRLTDLADGVCQTK